ncbi:ABC transporter permease [Desulfosarcina cetonica]|uniref:ABC transporter permease n=1 Tax=Desulfosarcina cetonica TaxID=90730 RepID=UPI001FEDFEED|nr:ABC transporter permease [Desulfosarcina cetonica]
MIGAFLFRRTLTAVFVFWGATFITYALMALAPGDASMEIALARYGDTARGDTATIEWVRQKAGLDRPMLVQYGRWLKHVLVLDFGKSLVEEVPVWTLIRSRFGNTLLLAVWAIGLALCLSIPIGILSGVKQGTWMDTMGVALPCWGYPCPITGWAFC